MVAKVGSNAPNAPEARDHPSLCPMVIA
ncbi:hypothetical protein N7447_000039 [Penicillium robsamsonii]|nr:hypothetical protein N7447_000039 [Penicillium robsamsonii]